VSGEGYETYQEESTGIDVITTLAAHGFADTIVFCGGVNLVQRVHEPGYLLRYSQQTLTGMQAKAS
jgi:hypothetical protein